MTKKIIRLTEEEFGAVIRHAVNEVLTEIDAGIYARIHNATQSAKQRQLTNIPNQNKRGKTNLDIIQQGIRLNQEAKESLLSSFKSDYLFHCNDLTQVAALLVFELEDLYELTPQKAILRGRINFNGTPLNGSIIVDLISNNVVYNYKGRSPRYKLQIDPSKKQLWDSLIDTLKKVVEKWV